MKPNIKHLVLLLLIFFPLCLYANDPFAKLPSEETKNQISEMSNSATDQLPTRDWWSGSANGEGPPGSGSGGGGAVGTIETSLVEGTIPLLTAGLLYVSFLIIRRHQRRE